MIPPNQQDTPLLKNGPLRTRLILALALILWLLTALGLFHWYLDSFLLSSLAACGMIGIPAAILLLWLDRPRKGTDHGCANH